VLRSTEYASQDINSVLARCRRGALTALIRMHACRAEEVMAPVMLWKAKGYDLKVVSVKGGKVPMDAASFSDDFKTEKVTEFQADGAQR
jgi:NADPH-dependent glutamate synthase beta subunit-like oxidoreductase